MSDICVNIREQIGKLPSEHPGLFKEIKSLQKLNTMKGETAEIRIVKLWHEALNYKHKIGLSELVTENVRIKGPKGETKGVNIMLEWVDRANITLTPERYFQSGSTIVVEELAVWHEAETEKETGSAMVASVFILEKGLISSIERLDSLTKAFEVTGLTESNLVELK